MGEPLHDPDEALLGSGYPVDDPELEAVLAAVWDDGDDDA